MGITIREIVFDIGGGVSGDKQFKAVQIGGHPVDVFHPGWPTRLWITIHYWK